MHGDLSRNPEKAFMLFTKVYVYNTNTKKPWNKLTAKQRNHKNFQWTCSKWFFVSNEPLTIEDVNNHIIDCPELKESADNILKNNVNPVKKWKQNAAWADIYAFFPLTEYDLKLLLNVIGIRMLHFVNNKK